jgi:FMN phosphatase YigB (HAD superfamily)
MRNYSMWLIDLDDTLQMGAVSWAEVYLFPEMIERTAIKPARATFAAALNRAQELYEAGKGNEVIGDQFFEMLGWPREMIAEILERFARDYRPALFDDTLAFLDWATARRDHLYLVSNNKQARPICDLLGITRYFAEILTPAEAGVDGKPDPALWEYLKPRTQLPQHTEIVLVGNNLVTDGAFARSCGLDCIIVDRYNRFEVMPGEYQKVSSLSEIMSQLSH